MIKVIRNLIVSMVSIYLLFMIGGSLLMILMSAALGYSVSQIINYLLPIND